MWIYQGKTITSSADIPKEFEKAVGFIYMITQISTGKRYIGKKLLTKSATKTVKGVKKKLRKESDWVEYWSSSPQILAWIEEAGGTSDFKKEILIFCNGKGGMVYAEELALYMVGALESDKWINENIRSKVYSTWVNKDLVGIGQLRKTLAFRLIN
jgi:hypothetical protein